jgi:hypothetical protein
VYQAHGDLSERGVAGAIGPSDRHKPPIMLAPRARKKSAAKEDGREGRKERKGGAKRGEHRFDLTIDVVSEKGQSNQVIQIASSRREGVGKWRSPVPWFTFEPLF